MTGPVIPFSVVGKYINFSVANLIVNSPELGRLERGIYHIFFSFWPNFLW